MQNSTIVIESLKCVDEEFGLFGIFVVLSGDKKYVVTVSLGKA